MASTIVAGCWKSDLRSNKACRPTIEHVRAISIKENVDVT